jgi:hypothetical protein
MRDLIQEGRHIQQSFKKSMGEGRTEDDYTNAVQNRYMEMADELKTIGKFTFSNATKQNIGGASNDWYAKTRSGKKLIVTFEPFDDARPMFYVDITLDNTLRRFSNDYVNAPVSSLIDNLDDIAKKFDKNVQPSDVVEDDAKFAISYIKNVLNSPDLKKLLDE